MTISCSGCGATWTGLSRAHCTRCHNTMNSVAAFDMHLPFCADGAAIDMPRNAEGYFITREYPEEANFHARKEADS